MSFLNLSIVETISKPQCLPGGGSIQINMRSSSTSTTKVTSKNETANGVETVTTYENGVLKSHTVNGVAQDIEGGNVGGSPGSD